MESDQEFIAFAKEILSQKPRRGMVKVYLIGSVLAFFGVMIGIVETICKPFSTQDPMDEELTQLVMEQQMKELEKADQRMAATVIDNVTINKQRATLQRRNSANRLHAS